MPKQPRCLNCDNNEWFTEVFTDYQYSIWEYGDRTYTDSIDTVWHKEQTTCHKCHSDNVVWESVELSDPSDKMPITTNDKEEKMTETIVSPDVTALQSTIESLQNDLKWSSDKVAMLRRQIADAERMCSDWVDEEYITESIFENLADNFGWETTKNYDVTINFTWSGTVTAPRGFDMEELDQYVNIEVNESYYSDGLEMDGSVDIDMVDWNES